VTYRRDSRFVYVSGYSENAVTVFERTATGGLLPVDHRFFACFLAGFWLASQIIDRFSVVRYPKGGFFAIHTSCAKYPETRLGGWRFSCPNTIAFVTRNEWQDLGGDGILRVEKLTRRK
jgi:hypothetical protein